jgi:hypothetical protein
MTNKPETPGRCSARVQGDTVRARDKYVHATFGAEASERYRGAASAHLGAFFRGEDKPPGGWLPFELLVESVVLADRMFGKGDLALAWDMGTFSATNDLPVWKRMVMKRVNPTMMLTLASSVWSHHYDGGRLLTRVTGPTGMLITIADFPSPHRAHCLSVAGWMLGSMRMGPRKNTIVRELGCRAAGGRSCDFQLSWEE